MARLYKRMSEITISQPIIKPLEIVVPPNPNKPVVSTTDYNVVDKVNQVIITDLDFDIHISKKKGAASNTLNLTIYNISDTATAILEEVGAIIVIKAGYESVHEVHSRLPTLFIGQVDGIEVYKEGDNTITKITAGDGQAMLKNQRVSYQAIPDTTVAKVITDLASSFTNVVIGHLALEDIEGETFPTGYTGFGRLRDVLEEVCKSRKLRFSIDGNAIYVFPDSWYRIAEQTGSIPYESTEAAAWEKNASTAKVNNFNQGDLLTFTPSDVISARFLVDRKDAPNGSGKGAAGVALKLPTYTKFNLLIDKIKLTEDFGTKVAGDFTIESVDINLQSRDGEWATTLQLTSDAKGA